MSNKSKERHRTKTEYFEYLKDTARAVDNYVGQFFQTNIQDSRLVNQLMERYRFGKPQLRPAQVRMAYELVGGNEWKKAIPACAAVETKDTGYYCLDDFFDSGADPSLAILGGVFAVISYGMVKDLFLDFSPEQVKKTIEELVMLDSQNAGAALIDLNLKYPNPELYLQKARGYNFWEQALKIGSILGNAKEGEVERLGLAGRNIGMGYIIANDTWDFAKKLEDFRAGKYTLPIIFAFEKANEQDRKKLEMCFGQENLSHEQIEGIRRIVVRSGAIDDGKQLAKQYCDEGIRELQSFTNSKARRMLEFATTMTQRNKFFSFLEGYRLGANQSS